MEINNRGRNNVIDAPSLHNQFPLAIAEHEQPAQK
uniref:Uncharacterized protein n=1 Tax=Rhizophora mucronata TaxID=61149 RepID=A0A2P2IRB4_RHIMU